jgi:hypothetical protein
MPYCYTNLSKRKQLWLIKHLRQLGNRERHPTEDDAGICYELMYTCRVYPSLVRELCLTWPKFNGDPIYPIPGSPTKYIPGRNVWGADQYGNDRRDLCLFLATAIEDKLIEAELKALNKDKEYY